MYDALKKNLLKNIICKNPFSSPEITKNKLLLWSFSGILLATWFDIRIFSKVWEQLVGRLIQGSYFSGKYTGEVDLWEKQGLQNSRNEILKEL